MTPLPAHLLALLLAQAVASPAPAPPQPPPAPTAAPTSVDELVVTAPRQPPPPPTYGVGTGSGAREFDAEVVRKDQMRRYRETGSMKDYPGVRCAIFHHC